MLWIAIFMAALFAACSATLLRMALRPAGTRHALAGVLPAPWRVAWPWLDYLAGACGALLSWRSRKRLQGCILRAGLARHISPGHMAAAQWLSALFGVMSGLGLAGAVLPPGLWGALAAAGLMAGAVAAATPRLWLGAEIRRRAARMRKELPFLLDMTTLCVESGLNLQGALQQAAHNGPDGPLRDELLHALTDMRTGMPRMTALRAWAARVDLPPVRALTAALAQADTLGMSLGPILRAQSEQRRTERFQRAERLAMQAPVKMLFPLIACIFPCTFIVLGFPIAVQLLEAAS